MFRLSTLSTHEDLTKRQLCGLPLNGFKEERLGHSETLPLGTREVEARGLQI